MGQQPVWIMIALVLDAVIAVTGILIGPSLNLTGLLAVGPLLACARCTGRVTAPYLVSQGTVLGRRGRVRVSAEDEQRIWVGGGTTTLVSGTIRPGSVLSR